MRLNESSKQILFGNIELIKYCRGAGVSIEKINSLMVSIFFIFIPVLPIAVHLKEYMLQEAEHRCYSLRVIRYARITNDLCLFSYCLKRCCIKIII